MMLKLLIVFVVFATILNESQSSIIKPHDFDTSVMGLIDTVNKWFGLNVDYMFNKDKHYPPIEEDVTFWIYSPGAPQFSQLRMTDNADYIKSKMVHGGTKGHPLGFLIHGWVDSFDSIVARPGFVGWMKSTAKVWAINNNMSVICVDWNRLANYGYSISVKHTKLVGKYIGQFIEGLQQKVGLSLDDVTLTGHSMGAQISGFAGQWLNGDIGHIIGLDPAGPLFTLPIDMGINERLDPTDAKYVQVLYTACGTIGSHISIGHGNFWANGGVLQPGCILPGLFGVKSDSPEAITCSHLRAVLIFRSACNPLNIYQGYECTIPAFCNMLASGINQGSVLPGFNLLPPMKPIIGCRNPTKDRFGIYSKQVNGNFQLTTKAKID